MARFQLTQAMTVGHARLRAGRTICDGTACSAGDFVWTGLNANTVSPGMVPLDAGATTLKNASKFAGVSPGNPTGVDSVDA
jgi:hypothetical protein